MIRPTVPIFSICYIDDSVPIIVEAQDLKSLEQTERSSFPISQTP
jgi:hypothetical protein